MFADDGFTLLNTPKEFDETSEGGENIDIHVKINLEEVVDNNVHLLGKYYNPLLSKCLFKPHQTFPPHLNATVPNTACTSHLSILLRAFHAKLAH